MEGFRLFYQIEQWGIKAIHLYIWGDNLIKSFCTAFATGFEYHKNDFVLTEDPVLCASVIESQDCIFGG